MKHFMITGGAGFIGSHLTEELLAKGYRITVVDNLITGHLHNLQPHPMLSLIQKDILLCQPSDFISPIDGIAHLAAIPSVAESWLEPIKTHNSNLSAIVSVINLCQALEIPKLVFASSAAVYGNLPTTPILEDLDAVPLSPYGLQKLVSEQYASLFATQIGFSFVSLRLFNVFGTRQSPNSPYSGVISLFINAMRNGLPITIYGDGTQTRDFIYVKDVAKAFATALEVSLTSGSSLICNLGTGKSVSLLHLIEIFKQHFPQWKSDVRFAKNRLGDIQDSQADISRALSMLNFQPQWSVESSLQFFLKSFFSHETTRL